MVIKATKKDEVRSSQSFERHVWYYYFDPSAAVQQATNHMKRAAATIISPSSEAGAGADAGESGPKRAKKLAGSVSSPSSCPLSLPGPLQEGELMHSTSTKSAHRTWLQLTPVAQQRDATKSYCSTDGSSTGWHSSVFVAAGEHTNTVHLRAKWGDMKGSRNVGAEASGYLLGVQTLARKYQQHWGGEVVFLADFLNALAWDCGGAKYNHEVLTAVYGEVSLIKKELQESGSGQASQWARIHHPGHQSDNSWYTTLNLAADNLASLGTEVDCVVPLSMLMDGTLTMPLKKRTSKGKAASQGGNKEGEKTLLDKINEAAVKLSTEAKAKNDGNAEKLK